VRKRIAYERAGVREFWLLHPLDRMLTIYRLEDGRYGYPEYHDTIGSLTPTSVPGGRRRVGEGLQRSRLNEAHLLRVHLVYTLV